MTQFKGKPRNEISIKWDAKLTQLFLVLKDELQTGHKAIPIIHELGDLLEEVDTYADLVKAEVAPILAMAEDIANKAQLLDEQNNRLNKENAGLMQIIEKQTPMIYRYRIGWSTYSSKPINTYTDGNVRITVEQFSDHSGYLAHLHIQDNDYRAETGDFLPNAVFTQEYIDYPVPPRVMMDYSLRLI